MRSGFYLYLLGTLRLEKGGSTQSLPTRKDRALPAYLPLFPQSHAREQLAARFRGDFTNAHARASLRLALTDLRSLLGRDLILADREKVQLNLRFTMWIDTAGLAQIARRVMQQLSEGGADQLLRVEGEEAIRAYSELPPDFYDDWLESPLESWRTLFFDAALKLIQVMRSQSQYKTAIELAQKNLAVDKANEGANQHLMVCNSAVGGRTAARLLDGALGGTSEFSKCVKVPTPQ